jgi:hypothetical protein
MFFFFIINSMLNFIGWHYQHCILDCIKKKKNFSQASLWKIRRDQSFYFEISWYSSYPGKIKQIRTEQFSISSYLLKRRIRVWDIEITTAHVFPVWVYSANQTTYVTLNCSIVYDINVERSVMNSILFYSLDQKIYIKFY